MILRALILLSLAGCVDKKACKPETVLLVIDGAMGADNLAVTVSDDLGRTANRTIVLDEGVSGGTVEVDFTGYPEGHVLTWEVTALTAGYPSGHKQDATTLAAGCTLIEIHLETVDLSGADLLAPGCTKDNQCGSGGSCVDGYCCDSQCLGICQTCKQPGHEGKCVTLSAPPAGKQCPGTGVCAGVCNGVEADCTFSSAPCSGPVCTGGMSYTSGSCSLGMCALEGAIPCNTGVCSATACAAVNELSPGVLHTCAVLSDGTVRCFGDNGSGELGASPPPDHSPVTVPGISNATHVAAGLGWTCAALSDSTVKCWGFDANGYLGNGINGSQSEPPVTVLTAPATPLTGVVALAANSRYTCAVTGGHGAYCWGGTLYIADGLVGGAGFSSLFALPVCARDSGTPCAAAADVAEIAVADDHACYRTMTGEVACWGKNLQGDCGVPGAAAVAQPTTLAGLSATHIAVNDSVSCASLVNQTVACWGGNSNGQLGRGTPDASPHPTPSPVCADQACTNALQLVSEIAVGSQHACAIMQSQVTCWGRNTHGQLLTGDKMDRFFAGPPTSALTSSDLRSVGDYGCTNHAVNGPKCWGDDEFYQLGDGDTADKLLQVTPHLGN